MKLPMEASFWGFAFEITTAIYCWILFFFSLWIAFAYFVYACCVYMCAYVCVCVCVNIQVLCACRAQWTTCKNLFSFFYHVGSGDQIQVISLNGRCSCLLSHQPWRLLYILSMYWALSQDLIRPSKLCEIHAVVIPILQVERFPRHMPCPDVTWLSMWLLSAGVNFLLSILPDRNLAPCCFG